MMTVYIICLAVGGALVALAALGGLDGVDFDSEFDADVNLENRSRESKNKPRLNTKSPGFRLRLPFGSLRFWTFGVCCFGLTGIILSILNPALTLTFVNTVAVAIGVLCGTIIVWTFDILRSQEVNSLVQSHDLIGLSATVEIPFNRNSRGKVRLNVMGSNLYLMAMTEENQEFSPGDGVFIVAMEKNRVWVVSEESLDPSNS